VHRPALRDLPLLRDAREQPVRGEVVREHRRHETPDAALAGRVRQRLRERRAQPAVLEVVGDDERDLGDLGVARQPHPPPDADEHVRLLGPHRHERDVVAEVDLGQIAQLGRAQRPLRREEALVGAALREVLHPGGKQGLVVRPDRPDHGPHVTFEAHDHTIDGRAGAPTAL